MMLQIIRHYDKIVVNFAIKKTANNVTYSLKDITFYRDAK